MTIKISIQDTKTLPKKHFSWGKHKYSIVSIAGKIVLICLLVAHQMQPS